jgi:hypothetical protein
VNPQRLSAFVSTLLLAAFVVLGICSVAGRLDLRPPHIGAPLAGIGGAQRILESAEKIKPGSSVLVVGPGDDNAFCETFFSISYLLWPRPVWELGQVEEGKKPRFKLMPMQQLKPAAIFLYRLQTPRELSAASKKIGPDLSTILLPENDQ